jgi:hypothetical protein
MVLAASDRIPPVPSYSGCPPPKPALRLQGSHLLRRCFPDSFDFDRLRDTHQGCQRVLQPRRGLNHAGLGSSPFARHYLGNLRVTANGHHG